MSFAKVLFIIPNPRSMSLIAPIVSSFYNILKKKDIELKFFDTTFYDVSDHYVNPETNQAANYSVKSFAHNLPKELISNKNISNLHKDFRDEIIRFQPDMIMASALESTMGLTREMLGAVRNLGIPHILGGTFATFAPRLCLKYPEIDAICVGEGESVLVDLVSKVKKKESLKSLPNVWYKDEAGEIITKPLSKRYDIDKIDRFTIEPYHESRFIRAMSGKMYRMFPVETHRGCPLTCTFCNSPLQNTTYKSETGEKYFRKRSVSKVMEDIGYFANDCKAEYLFFWADHFFTYTKSEIDEFCERYAEFKIPFYVQSYPSALDKYKINKLFEVGLHRIGMGVEHGNEKFRREVIKRNYSNSSAIKNVSILQDKNIEYSCNNIVGFPYETPELHWDTIHLNRALKANNSSCAIFTPFQGTPLREIAIKEGFLKDEEKLAPSNFDYSILEMPQFPPELIAGKSRTFNLYVNLPENRWKDVEKAEKFTPEGNKIFQELRQEIEELS